MVSMSSALRLFVMLQPAVSGVQVPVRASGSRRCGWLRCSLLLKRNGEQRLHRSLSVAPEGYFEGRGARSVGESVEIDEALNAFAASDGPLAKRPGIEFTGHA